jgi:hypothetical protein
VYVDKLNEIVETAFHEKMSDMGRSEHNRRKREIDRRRTVNRSNINGGLQNRDFRATRMHSSKANKRARTGDCSVRD